MKVIIIKNTSGASKTYNGKVLADQESYQIPNEDHSDWASHSGLLTDIGNADAIVNDGAEDITSVSKAISYLTSNVAAKVKITQQDSFPAFADKTLYSGEKLFRRKHGQKQTITANSSGTISVNVPYAACKINKAEIVNCKSGDEVDLKVLDTPTGAISTVPNYALNQFGFLVVMPDGIYIDKSDYDADLIQDMKVEITYHNNSNSDREVGVNITFHEVV